MPEDGLALAQLLSSDIKTNPVVVMQDGEGAIRFRIEINESKSNDLIRGIANKYSLSENNSSSLTADNLSGNYKEFDSPLGAQWVPPGYKIKRGLTGDGLSLAVFEKQNGVAIVIVYARSRDCISGVR